MTRTSGRAAAPGSNDFAPAPLTDADRAWVASLRARAESLRRELGKRIVGQQEIVEQLLISFFSGGHALLVGVPGLAKTMMIRSLSETLGLDFARIQFTPDLMPSDITGTDIIAADAGGGDRGFRFLSGPIFHQMILADEINRTPPKTLAALLEAMEEFTVHVGGKGYPVPEPFFVLATQNPIEQEGTYTLPAAALDRFMVNVLVDYPDEDTETEIVELTTTRHEEQLFQVMDQGEVERALDVVRRLPVREEIVKYAIDLVRHTRPDSSPREEVTEYVAHGASPRATQALIIGAKARAVLAGRTEVYGEDVRAIAVPVLRHRLQLSFHANSEGVTADDVINRLVRVCPRPSGDKAPSGGPGSAAVAGGVPGRSGRLTSVVWGPETRRIVEQRTKEKQEAAPSKLDQIIRDAKERRLPIPHRIVALLAALVATVLLLSGVQTLTSGVEETLPFVLGIAALAFGLLWGYAALAHLAGQKPDVQARRRYGMTNDVPWRNALPLRGDLLLLPFGLLLIFQLLALGFTQVRVHPVASRMHGWLLEAGGSPLSAGGFDWAGLILAATTLLATIMVFVADRTSE